MAKESSNKHRWRAWLSPAELKVVEDATEALEHAWGFDKQYPNAFPVNVDNAIWQLRASLMPHQRVQQTPLRLPAPRSEVTSLSDLIDERTVSTLFEQQNSKSYKEVLVAASRDGVEGGPAFKKILNCLQHAYAIDMYGTDSIPKPRVHLLHRELLEIADQLLDTPEGAIEFLDDVCPCGKSHNTDAVRKLRSRLQLQRKGVKPGMTSPSIRFPKKKLKKSREKKG